MKNVGGIFKLVFLLGVFLNFLACNNAGEDNSDGKNDNLKFSKEQLGVLTFDTSEINFGEIVLGNSKKRFITVSNTGNLPLIFNSTTFNGRNFHESFSYAGGAKTFPGEGGTCSNQLTPHSSCVLAFSFTPQTQKHDQVLLQIAYQDGLAENTQKVTFTGYGGERADLSFSLDSVEFSYTDVNNVQERELLIQNIGGQIARDFSINIIQTPDSLGRELFDIIEERSTCPLTHGRLGINQTCKITLSSTVASDQAYQNYIASLNFNYQYDPDSTTLETENLDIFQQVVSIEGYLSSPTASLKFNDFVNGHISTKAFAIQNTGYKELSIESITITGDGGSASVNITDCTERNDERFNSSTKLLLAPNESCILDLVFAPNFSTLPFDFSSSNIVITYHDGKNGLQTTPGFGFEANLFDPAKIEVLMSTDPLLGIFDVGNVFIANDNRFNQEQSFTVQNNGGVLAKELNLSLSGIGSQYYTMTHDCPELLAKNDQCQINLSFTPLKNIYDTNLNLSINSLVTLSYKAGDSNSLGVDRISETRIQTTGNATNLPHLVFSHFDSSASGSTEAVAGSPAYYHVSVKNVGASPENSFSLAMSNTTNFSLENTPATIDGKTNCHTIDQGAGNLPSGEECIYRIRSFSGSPGDLDSELTINFQGTSQQSAIHTYSASFKSPGKLALSSPTPVTKAVIKSYPSFNYPGVGTLTAINDSSVTSYFSESPRALGASLMTFPTLPNSENFDFAYLELGHNKIGATQEAGFKFKNTGEFDATITSLSISHVQDLTTNTDVTSANYFTIDSSSSCLPTTTAKVISPNGSCQNTINYALSASNLYRASLSFTYTLGHTINPTSETLETYTSTINLYIQGYNGSHVAKLEPVAPTTFASTQKLSVSAVFGGDNTDSTSGTLRNTGVMPATNIHYTVIKGGEYLDVTTTSSPLAITDLTKETGSLARYYRLGTTQCSGVTTNTMNVNEDCYFNIDYHPQEAQEIPILIYYRYHNGITYEEDFFTVQTIGLAPAKLAIKNLSENSSSQYVYEFGEKTVGDSHPEYLEVKNEGGVSATNVQINVTASPFQIDPSDHPDQQACTSTIDPDSTCYLKLTFNPTYASIEQLTQGLISFNWQDGIISSGSPNIVSTNILASGFTEEKHSRHQGWTSVELAGYNQEFADILATSLTTKPDGSAYQPHELGLVKFKWNAMADEGVHTNNITAYHIYKNDTGEFDIRNETPIATINAVSGQLEYEYNDQTIQNFPGRVWFYYIVPVRSASQYLSRVNLDNYPAAILRVAIPFSYSVGLHKYTRSMAVCKMMGLDINDANNIDLSNNGCLYTDDQGVQQTFSENYDTHMDMYEATSNYASQQTITNNSAGGQVISRNFDQARAACQNKTVSFSTLNFLLSQNYTKDLPNRRDHFILSQKSGGYSQTDCQIIDNEIIAGHQSNCLSDFGLENMAGGIPEWTRTQISGFGKGIRTTLGPGRQDNSITGIDFKYLFNPVQSGLNNFTIDDINDPIDSRCFNPLTGLFHPQSLGACPGDNLLSLTSDPSQANSTTLYLLSEEPSATEFKMYNLSQNISSSSIGLFAIAGGGDQFNSNTPAQNYSPYTTNFTLSVDNNPGFRCSLQVPY